MTLLDLRDEISALGFDGQLTVDDELKIALRRALRMIFREVGIVKIGTLHQAFPKILCRFTALSHVGGESLALPLAGRAYSLALSGRGSFKVSDKSGSRTEEFDSDLAVIRGFISGGTGEIEFLGEEDYTLLSLVVYGNPLGSSLDDIPTSEGAVSIDMRERFPDFSGFVGTVYREDGLSVGSVILEDSIITFRRGDGGVFSIPYYRTPKDPTGQRENEEIDLPEEYSHLPPLLVAYFLLLDSDPELADSYLARYKEALGALGRSKKYPTVWRSNGWA